MFKVYVSGNRIISNSPLAFALYDKSRLGEKVEGKILYSFYEAFYLLEKRKIEIFKDDKKILDFLKLAEKKEKNFFVKYSVFKNLREKGYIVKTALKFGADFRVYEKKDEHAKWIVFAVGESEKLKWHEFAAKNRIAHSTKKNLLIGIVDDEGDVLFYEIKWLKP